MNWVVRLDMRPGAAANGYSECLRVAHELGGELDDVHYNGNITKHFKF